jgi:hypothetical protein
MVELNWAIGGSLLMWKLGIESAPRDLDVMTTTSDFVEVCARVSSIYGPAHDAPHPTYRSKCFARFHPDGPVPIDVFADVAVETASGLARWAFDPGRIDLEGHLHWMRAVDWLQLYELFDRPNRVQSLKKYLASSGATYQHRPNDSLERSRDR